MRVDLERIDLVGVDLVRPNRQVTGKEQAWQGILRLVRVYMCYYFKSNHTLL